MKSLSERLDAILDAVLPKDAPRQPAPYVFDPSADGKAILKVTVDRTTGEFLATSGATKADAITAMERRLASS